MPISKKKIALIHVAKTQLGMGENEYRAALARVGVESSTQLNLTRFTELMEHFESLGFRSRAKQRVGRINLAKHKRRLGAKIYKQLEALGKPKGYADGIAAHMFHVTKIEWCDPDQLYKIIQALAMQQKREVKRAAP